VNLLWFRPVQDIFYCEIEVKICNSIMYNGVQPLDTTVLNMLLLNVNYEQNTMFINVACVGIGICRRILYILELFDSWDKIYSICCGRQLRETLFARNVLI